MRILHWNTLSKDERRQVLERPAQRDAARTMSDVRAIVEAVRRGGDAALRELTHRFDGVEVQSLEVSAREFGDAERALDSAQHAAIDAAIGTVRKFHEAQRPVAAAHRDRAGRDLRAHPRPGTRGRPVRSRGLCAAPLDRHHAGRAGRNRRLPAAHALHRAEPGREGRFRRPHRRAKSRESSGYSRWAAHRPSPPWPTAPSRSPNATSCSAREMPGWRRRSRSWRATRRAPRRTCPRASRRSW